MLTVRDLSFFSVGRLSSTSISSTMLSSWVRCLFSLDVFGSFSSISVSANIRLVYYYFWLFNKFYFNKFELFKFTRMLTNELEILIYQCLHPPRDEWSFSCDLCLFCSISLHICILVLMPFSSHFVRLSVMVLYETNRSFYTL